MSTNGTTSVPETQLNFAQNPIQGEPISLQPSEGAEAFMSGKDSQIPDGPAPSIFESDPSPVNIPEHLLSDPAPQDQGTAEERLQQIAEDYGLSAEHFSGLTPESAEAAARLLLDREIQQGLALAPYYTQGQPGQSVQSPQPSRPENPPAAEPSLDFDDSELDPKISKALKAAIQQAQSAKSRADQLEQQMASVQQQYQRQQQQVIQQQNLNQAMSFVDSLNDPRFGTSSKRDGLQTLALRQLFEVADALAIVDNARGQQVRPIDQRLKLAIKRIPGAASPAKPASATSAAAPAAAPVVAPMTDSAVPPAQKPVMLGTLHKDPTLLRQFAQVLRRGR